MHVVNRIPDGTCQLQNAITIHHTVFDHATRKFDILFTSGGNFGNKQVVWIKA